MSDIYNEDDPQTEDDGLGNEVPAPNAPGVPPRPASKLARVATTFKNNREFQKKMLDSLESIRMLNDRIRINTESTSTYLSQHKQDIERAKSIAKDAEQQGARFNDTDARRALASRKDLLLPSMQKNFDDLRASLIGGSQADRVAELRTLGLASHRGVVNIAGEDLSPDRLESIMQSMQRGDLDKTDRVANIFSARLEDALARRVRDEANPEQVAQALRLENIAEGRSTLEKLRGAIPFMGGLHGHGMHGTTGPTVPSRDFSLFGHDDEDVRQGMGARVAGRLAANVEAGGIRGGLARAGTNILGGAGLSALIPGLGEALIGYELLQQFGRNIPLVGSLMDARRTGIQSLQTGQLTGEGVQAGIAARFDAARLTPGGVLGELPVIGGFARTVGGLMHPFDPITNEIANQIVESVRTQGFTGDRARALYQGVASVYRDLGISVDQTTKMITEATRNGGESLGQIVTEMKTFDTAAHDLSMNVTEYASSVETAAEHIRQGGAGPGATTLAQSLIAALPLQMRNQQGVQTIQGVQQQLQPLIAAQMGVPQQYLQLPEYRGRAQAALTSTIAGLVAQMPGRTEDEQIANALNLPQLQGLNVPQVKQLLGRAQQSRGTGVQGIFRASLQSYRNRLTGLEGTQTRSVADMTDAQREALGIRVVNRSTSERGPFSHPTQYFDRQGNMITAQSQYQVHQDVSMLSDQQLRTVRQQTINQLDQAKLLTDPQRRALERLETSRDPGKFAEAVQRISRQRGPHRDAFDTPFGEIKITAGAGLKKVLNFNVTQRQAQYGMIPTNRAFPFEDNRTNPTNP